MTASVFVCCGLGIDSVELHGGEGAGVIVPQAASCRPEGPLSHSGRRLTLFSVLAGEGRMPEAGGPQGAPVAAALAAGLPAALSSIATATGDQTAAARAEASGRLPTIRRTGSDCCESGLAAAWGGGVSLEGGLATSHSRSAMPATEDALGQGLQWGPASPRCPH